MYGRIAAFVLALNCVLAASSASAQDPAPDWPTPQLLAEGITSGCVVVYWNAIPNLHHFVLTRESPAFEWVINDMHTRYQEDCGLQADTDYRYRICAFFV